MKIKKIETQYGVINFVEVAGIDMGKDKTHSVKFDPEYVAYNKYIGEDSRNKNLKNEGLSDFKKEQLGYFYNSVFCFPLEEVNLDWHIINKNFDDKNEYLNRMKKAKQCPIVIDNSTFMKWFVKIKPYLNEEWKASNEEYMNMMEDRILIINKKMLNGFKNQNIKEIRGAIKLAADINFNQDGRSAIQYAVESQNKELMNYLINKKVLIPSNLIVEQNNTVYDLYNNYVKILNNKIKSPKF